MGSLFRGTAAAVLRLPFADVGMEDRLRFFSVRSGKKDTEGSIVKR